MDIEKLKIIQWGAGGDRKSFRSWLLARYRHLNNSLRNIPCRFKFLEHDIWSIEDAICILEQLVAEEEGWTQGLFEEEVKGLHADRTTFDDVNYESAERRVFSALTKDFHTGPFDLYECVSKLTGLPREEVKRRYLCHAYAMKPFPGPKEVAAKITKPAKAWIEVRKAYGRDRKWRLGEAGDDTPEWKVFIKCCNGKDLMRSRACSPRKIDALIIARKLSKLTGLEIRD